MSEAFEMNAGWANSSFKDDNSGKLIVFFHPFQKKMNKQSELEGRPVYKEVTFITKIVPGDKGHVIDRPIREDDKVEFPEKWEHYQRTKENKVTGIPIDHWHSLSDTQKMEFKAMHIETVEQFAGLSDANLQKIPGGHDLRKKAQIFIEAGKDAELLGQVRREAQEREKELTDRLAALEAMLEKMTSPNQKKAG